MDAALYFELVEEVTRIDGPAKLELLTERVMAAPLHPLERRVLDRALRARGEALILQRDLLQPSLFDVAPPDATSLAVGG